MNDPRRSPLDMYTLLVCGFALIIGIVIATLTYQAYGNAWASVLSGVSSSGLSIPLILKVFPRVNRQAGG